MICKNLLINQQRQFSGQSTIISFSFNQRSYRLKLLMTHFPPEQVNWCKNGTYLSIVEINRKPLRILMSSLDAYGHFNASLGLAEKLLARGHEVFYANRSGYRAAVEKRGIKFIPIEKFDKSMAHQQNNEVTLKFIDNYSEQMEKSSLDRLNGWKFKDLWNTMEYFSEMKRMEKVLDQIIKYIEPDLVIGDFTFVMPLFMKSSIPCIPLMSTNPLPLYEGRGPPVSSGYSVNGPKDLWEKYRKSEKMALIGLRLYLRPWFWRYRANPPEAHRLRSYAKYFGIYICPQILDYPELGRPAANWLRMDTSIRESEHDGEFEIPESLANLPGKLIYLSMGSLGSVNLKLMNRLVKMLSNCPHRFIVSKGARGDQLQLASNMWGENFVNQLAILPKVDLVITNGGNNTVIETLAAGKPMIIMPLFYDQLDNAQRIEDKQLGRRIDPFHVKQSDLYLIIETLLNDDEMKSRITKVSQDMRTSDARCNVIQLLESLAYYCKNHGPLEPELKRIIQPQNLIKANN